MSVGKYYHRYYSLLTKQPNRIVILSQHIDSTAQRLERFYSSFIVNNYYYNNEVCIGQAITYFSSMQSVIVPYLFKSRFVPRNGARTTAMHRKCRLGATARGLYVYGLGATGRG